MSADLKNVKIKMLNEFKSQLNDVFNNYLEHKLSFEEYTDNITWIKDVWSQTRIDIKNIGNSTNSIEILENNNQLYISYPNWFSNEEGKGCIIEYENKNIDFNFKCINKGEINFIFRGKDFRNINNVRRPVYINYTKIIINDEIKIEGNNLIWHNEPFKYNLNCNDGKIVSLHLESDNIYDYFPKLMKYIENIINNVYDVNIAKDRIFKYIEHEKMLLDVDEIFNRDLTDTDEDTKMLFDSINNSMNIYSLYKKNERLTDEFNKFKDKTNKILNSYNSLFNSIFIYNNVEPKKLVKSSRELNMQLLDFIDNVCKKYELQWWLHAGTLLGAIRHNGFIPWDDDCDINMIRGDYEKFLTIIDKEIKDHGLDNNLEVNTTTITNNNVYLPFIKVNYWINKDLYAFIDIFPTDYTDKVIDNIDNIFKEENRRIGRELRNGADRTRVLNQSFKRLNVSKEKTDTIISGVEDPVLSIHSYESIFPLKPLKFENREYPCPNDYKTYIISEYGYGYNKIPKVIYNHGFYEYISNHENVYENFNNEINKLKTVNENF